MFKQMRVLYGAKPDKDELMEMNKVVHSNTIKSMQDILKKNQEWSSKAPDGMNAKDFKVCQRTAARAAGAHVTHGTPCGLCSSLEDLAVRNSSQHL